MTLRSQTVAIIVLLAAVGAVFVLVGMGGVNTDARPAQSTPVPPTAIPTSTPLPEGSADAWTESLEQQGQWVYSADPNLSVSLVEASMTMAEAAQALGAEAPTDDADFPVWSLLEGLKATISQQIAGSPLESAMQIDGPTMKVYQDVAVSFLSLTTPEGIEGAVPAKTLFAGFQETSGNIHVVRADLPLEDNVQLSADFDAWLDKLIDETVVAPAATEEAAPPAATEEVAPVATEEAVAPAATEEAVVPAATEEALVATEEAVAPAVTEEAAAPAITEEAPATTEEAAAAIPPGEAWTLTSENYVYVADPTIDAQMSYELTTIEDYIANSMLQAPAEDVAAPLEDLLGQIRTQIEAQITQMALVLEEGQFVGPVTEDFGGVPTRYIRFQVNAQTFTDGTPFEGTDQVYALVDAGDGRLVSFRFSTAGEPSEAAFEAFQSFLTANAEAFATPGASITPTENWLAAGGQAEYTPRPEDGVSLVYNISLTGDFITQLSMQPAAEDSEAPLADLLGQLRTQFESFGGEGMVFDGPTQETINDVPAAIMRVSRASQEATDTAAAISAMDVGLALFNRGEGEIVFVQYVAEGEPDQAVYDAFRAWVEEHISQLATATVPLPQPEPEPAATEAAE